MVSPNPAADFYEELQFWGLEQIRACQQSISLMAEIREENPDDWEMEELTRAIIFDEAQIIESLRAEVERAAAREES